jgi:hypothetical protein
VASENEGISAISVDRLLGTLLARNDETQRQLIKIEASLERIANQHDTVLARIAALELRNAEQSGGMRMLLLFSGGAATLGGIFATLVGKFWPNWG